ncbi:cytochrome c oxidase subunit II [Sulfobacillus harzensis]|uniref:cytochrome-c oxidase n=1 Tax=Sulfobacillus harzensis TaxID=2729629 RepID=A0A7Y0Q266_9FIRM|nr:cytochrome c oxidase subunit II [Sulfobacillus harzensis]NMP20854.1 cytochrome c oxidase subunit II [Sulfobacillus harzensis]
MANVVLFGILWIVLSILGEFGASAWIHSAPNGAGPYWGTMSNLGVITAGAFDFILIIAVPIFAFVVLMLVFSMIRFGVRKNSPDKGEAKDQTRANKAFIGIWIVVSILLNVFIWLHPNASGLEQVFAAQKVTAKEHPLIVDVTARQWEWIFSYPQYGISQSVNASGQDVLYLPVNRPVKFVMRSYDPFHTYDSTIDVIHSFWVPAFGVKMDVVPGETRTLVLTPTQLASTESDPMLRVQCAEVCGPGHPYMEANVHIVSGSAFASWAKSQASGS